MTGDLSVPAALISERMGLHFQENRWPDLIRGLERAATSLGFDNVHTFIAHLLADRFGQREVHALATHLTIGETYFFRTPETFSMLETRLLPELIAATQHTTRRLRIWSAGCATGQEPYSLAILVSRLIPKRTDWDITIMATDINPEALETAKNAEYTQWSFRDTPAWVAANYFTRVGEGRFRLDAAIRDMVTLRYLNLAEEVYPSLAGGMHDFDLILCRNVIMYFSRDVAKQVANRLQASVREGGYLMVTASEGSRDFQLPSTVTGGEIVYKKTAKQEAKASAASVASAAPVASAASTPPRAAAPVAKPAAARPAAKAPSRLERPAPAASRRGAQDAAQRPPVTPRPKQSPTAPPKGAVRPADSQHAAKEARLLADKGDLKQALGRCDAALECDKLNASLYYLKASILQELGRPDDAVQALQSTLFLDSGFAMARVMLGAIARGQSRTGEAGKYFRAALEQLAQMPANAVLPETDGLTAGEVAEMVTSLMGNERVS